MRKGLAEIQYAESVASDGAFPLVYQSVAATIHLDSGDHVGVLRAATDLQTDIARVAGRSPQLVHDEKSPGQHAILIGTIGKNKIIDRLIRDGTINGKQIAGKWESFLIQVVPQPMPGVASALVIAGSDKRGTIFGIYDLCQQIGVSPWHWWADVPVEKQDALFVKAGTHVQGPPAVKYRGIFLNDERPALFEWTREKFGGLNSKFYVKVFELLLRLKANYLWPAMWDGAFNDDDPLNPKLADEYGIVIGTSHHEPMLRAQKEWHRYGKGTWDYAKNAEVLHAFWDAGIERNRNYESIVTLAMRGDGDEPMSEEANVALLEKIVADQRQIISKRMNKDVAAVPQLWALYKEVQEYYEKGMRVPDDVTLLWCDDNFGNIRRLPTEAERKRPGGAGIYYHFDYVGEPRSYKWINTVPIEKIWEQMSLALNYGADRIWIVNVGDLKPMEFPIEFFLNFAWNPQRWPKEKLPEFTHHWAEREFGPEHASDIAEIIAKYTKFNGRRKPELLEPNTFSHVNYHEADTVLGDFKSIAERAERIYALLPEKSRDAFYQLVLHPAKASAIVTEMHVIAGRQHLHASQGRASSNELAKKVCELFHADAEISDYYNHTLAGGKWNHLMDQTHIGYTFWNQSPRNTMPPVTHLIVSDPPEMGIAVEGSPISPWRGIPGGIKLPPFDVLNQQRRWIDIFNRGKTAFDFTVHCSEPWIVASAAGGTCGEDARLWFQIDWSKAPTGTSQGLVRIQRSNSNEEDEDHAVVVRIDCFNPQQPKKDSLMGFVESDGVVCIEAEHFTKKIDTPAARWDKIADYGRTLSSMSIFPSTAASITSQKNSPCLEYQMYIFRAGKVELHAIVAPTLNFVPGRRLRFALAFDDQPPQVLDVLAENSQRDWEKSVEDNARIIRSTHTIAAAGYHTLKVWMVDPAVVLQRLIVDLGGLRPSYLGPPESFHRLPR